MLNSAGMPDPASIETVRAAVDTVSPATDGQPGAIDLNAHQHVIDMLELGLPGITDMFAALLDAYANDVRAAARFAELDLEGRNAVIRAMSTDESQDVRDVVDAIIVFGNGATFSEWSGYERASGRLNPPPTWAAVGFHGPVHGHPVYRENA